MSTKKAVSEAGGASVRSQKSRRGSGGAATEAPAEDSTSVAAKAAGGLLGGISAGAGMLAGGVQ